MTKGIQPVEYISLGNGPPNHIEGEVVEEALVCFTVNGVELATFMASPNDLPEMAVGFLFNEKIINHLNDIESTHISKSNCVEVWLKTPFTPPDRFIVTAGCGGGITFDDLSEQYPPLQSPLSATPDELIALMQELHQGAALYQRSRGIHTAVLADRVEILLQVEDVGRHNCLDKLSGAALLRSIPTQDRILLSSGRVSSEMINKARRMGTPIVCSRTSPTSLSVALAEAWDITIVAYLRQSRMRVYTHPWRLIGVPDLMLIIMGLFKHTHDFTIVVLSQNAVKAKDLCLALWVKD